jgi:RNA polymerase sigma factor (sigma-70 family)
MTDHQTEAMVIRCLLGDRDAFEDLVAEWNPSLTRYVVAMTSNPSHVDDLVQDTWVRVIRSLTRLKDPSSFPPWLFTIARRTFADQLRRNYREPVLEQLADDSSLGSETEELDGLLEARELLGELGPVEREVVVLHHLSGFPLAEIAEIAEVPLGTVKSRLHRARQQLKTLVENEKRRNDYEL